MDNRRRFSRTNISLPLEAIPFSPKKYFHTVSRDLSLIGARLTMSDFIAQGNFLRIDLNLIDCVLYLKAKIVWCNRERFSERYVAGLEFVEVDDNSRRIIAQFLQKVNPG